MIISTDFYASYTATSPRDVYKNEYIYDWELRNQFTPDPNSATSAATLCWMHLYRAWSQPMGEKLLQVWHLLSWPGHQPGGSPYGLPPHVMGIIVKNTSWVTELQNKCSAKVFHIDVGLKLISWQWNSSTHAPNISALGMTYHIYIFLWFPY